MKGRKRCLSIGAVLLRGGIAGRVCQQCSRLAFPAQQVYQRCYQEKEQVANFFDVLEYMFNYILEGFFFDGVVTG